MSGPDRNHIVARWHALYREIERREMAGASATELAPLRAERYDLGVAYARGLPRPALARCPFSGEALHHPIDTAGLDGMWWEYHAMSRSLPKGAPRTFFSLQGAMHLELPVEDTPFLVKPGPGVPFVLPRLLADSGMRAVVSTLEVGLHRAYPVVYFKQSGPPLDRPNEWGRNRFEVAGEGDKWSWGERFEDPDGYDYELEPWITRGQLLWIAPGDDTLTLRSTIDDCPYLRLAGPRTPQHVQDRQVWT